MEPDRLVPIAVRSPRHLGDASVLMSRLETAALMGMTPVDLDRLADAGKMPYVLVGASRKFDLYDIRHMDHRQPIPPAPKKKRSARPLIPPRLRFHILERDGFRCRYCGSTPDQIRLTVDHIISVADGGSSEADNLVAACELCNMGKGRRSLTVVA